MQNASYIFNSNDLQKMRDEMHRAVDLRIDLFLQNSRIIELLPSDNKIPWLKSEEVLFVFYNLLIIHKYIECNFTFFQSCFMGNEPSQGKITFLKPTNQLPYILKAIEEIGFIASCKHPHIRLAQHFLDQYGKPMNNKVLRSSLHKSISEKIQLFIEEELINVLLKHR